MATQCCHFIFQNMEQIRIEMLSNDGLINLIGDEALCKAGSINELKVEMNEGETKKEYGDRIYGIAHKLVMDAVNDIQHSGRFDFSFFDEDGLDDDGVAWYDGAIDYAVSDVIAMMLL